MKYLLADKEIESVAQILLFSPFWIEESARRLIFASEFLCFLLKRSLDSIVFPRMGDLIILHVSCLNFENKDEQILQQNCGTVFKNWSCDAFLF